MTTFPPWPGSSTALALKGGASEGRFDSATVCADGRVIYVWTSGNTLNQCHYPTPLDFFEADNAAATSAAAIPVDAGSISPRATVWRHPNTGNLYLFSSSRVTTLEARNKVWISPSGNGESSPGVPDWVLHATIQTSTAIFGGSAWHDATFGTGEPTVTATGRWLLPCSDLFYRDVFRSSVFSSDDEGLTWTQRVIIGFYMLGGIYGEGFSRNIVESGGYYYFGANGNVDGPKIARSSDNGTNWSITELGDGGYTANYPIDVDGATLYRLRWPYGGPSTIQSGSNYLSTSGWTNVLTLSGWGNNAGSAILQRIDENNDAFMMNGRLLSSVYSDPPDETPPDTVIDTTNLDQVSLSAAFTFHATEENSTLECSLDGADFTSCSSPIVYTELSYGDHIFAVRAIDESLNVDETPAEYEFTFEAPPEPSPILYDRSTPSYFPNTLGCSQHVAYVQSKCNGPRLCELKGITNLTYDRRLDDISEAFIEIAVGGDVENPCCNCLGDIEPWCHQLTIVREGDGVVWSGPIQRITYGYHSVRIEAKDKLAWLQVRINEDDIEFIDNTTVPLTTIAATIAEVAMADDGDSPCFLDCVLDLGDSLPIGENRSRVFPAFAGPTAFDDFQAMADSGIDYTVINHCLVLMGEDLPARAIGTLTDEHILGELELSKDGTQQGNRFFVRYDGDDDCAGICTPQASECPCPAVSDDVDQSCYGSIERIVGNDLGLQNIEDAEQTANTYTNASKIAPRRIEFPPGTRLSANTPWQINDMIPGQRVDVALSKLCFPIFESFKLQAMTVEDSSDGEIISVDLISLNITTQA